MRANINNRVQLIGFLGQELELKVYPPEGKIARMSMATHSYGKDSQGKKETITTWHNLVATGKTAEIMAKVLSKGQRILVEGTLSYRNHISPGTLIERNTAEIVVTDFKKLEAVDK